MATVTRKPGPDRDAIEKAVRDLKRKRLRVGFFDTAKYPNGTPVAYVAAIQEFGYPNGGIPPRPFMRPTVAQQQSAWRDSLRKGARATLNGRITTQQMFAQFGLAAAGDISKTISLITTPALDPSTIASRKSRRKSPGVSEKPLVDTGILIGAVSSQVSDK